MRDELKDVLDKEISYEELTECISNCKKGEAVTEDQLPNEFLKVSSYDMLKPRIYFKQHSTSLINA